MKREMMLKEPKNTPCMFSPQGPQHGFWHTWEGWLNHLGAQGWEVCSAGGYGWGWAAGADYDSGTMNQQAQGHEFMVILKRARAF